MHQSARVRFSSSLVPTLMSSYSHCTLLSRTLELPPRKATSTPPKPQSVSSVSPTHFRLAHPLCTNLATLLDHIVRAHHLQINHDFVTTSRDQATELYRRAASFASSSGTASPTISFGFTPLQRLKSINRSLVAKAPSHHSQTHPSTYTYLTCSRRRRSLHLNRWSRRHHLCSLPTRSRSHWATLRLSLAEVGFAQRVRQAIFKGRAAHVSVARGFHGDHEMRKAGSGCFVLLTSNVT